MSAPLSKELREKHNVSGILPQSRLPLWSTGLPLALDYRLPGNEFD